MEAHSSTGANVATCQKKAVCDSCGVSYGTVANHHFDDANWEKDTTGHWHKCMTTGCTEKKDFAQHTPDHQGNATEEYAIKCTECSFEIEPKLVHNYGAEWKSDKDNHWNECTCGDKANTATHKDENSDGKCDVCAYNMGTSTAPESPQTGDNNNVILWISLLMLSALSVVATTIFRKRSASAK